MDLFQRLLGTLQRTVDYISTFTTYLLGDEAHPGAEEAGSARGTVPHRNHHDCNVETTHDGAISPRDDLKAFEGPPIAETMPPRQEIQEASGKVFSCAQATEVILGNSKLPYIDEGQEDVGREFSESSHFLADDPKPRSSTTGSIDQRDSEGPVGAGELHPWGAEGRARMRPIQQELLEEMADEKACTPEKPPARGQGQEELGRAGEAEGHRKEEQEEPEGGEQEAPGGAASDGEEQRGLGAGPCSGGSPQQVALMVEDLRSEPDGELVGGANTGDDWWAEPDIEAGDEGVQPAMPEGAETGGVQEGGPGEAEARSHLGWEPEKEVPLEDAQGVGDVSQRGLEESEMEEPQLKELERSVKDEGTQWTEEENEGGSGEECVVEELRGGGAAWAERRQQEAAEMLEDLQPEPDGQPPGGTNLEDHQLEGPGGDGGGQPAAPDTGAQEGGPAGEAAAGSHLQREPEERAIWELQEEDPEGGPQKGDSQQRGLGAETEAHQPGQLEGFVRHEGAQRRQTAENEGDEQEETSGEEAGRGGQRGGAAWTGRPQQEVGKMVESQWLEAEGLLAGGAEAESKEQGEPDVETRDERSQQTILDGAETGGGQWGGQEGEAEVGRSLQREPGETVTSEERPEEGRGWLQWLEGAGETGGRPHGELEGPLGSQGESRTAELGLERDLQKDPEPLAGITVLGEEAGAAMAEEPVAQRQETEAAKRSLPYRPSGVEAPVLTGRPAVAGAFPEEVPSLDTSAQKERVLLRRKSSIRRAPSLKRPRPSAETPPLPETGPEDNSPSPPPSSVRPNLRHAGFGPMHPNMMAELQTRLRRPQ